MLNSLWFSLLFIKWGCDNLLYLPHKVEWESNETMQKCFRYCQALSLRVSSWERKRWPLCVSQGIANSPLSLNSNHPSAWFALLTWEARGSSGWILPGSRSISCALNKRELVEGLEWSLWPLGVTLGPKIMYDHLLSCKFSSSCLSPLVLGIEHGRAQMGRIYPVCIFYSF